MICAHPSQICLEGIPIFNAANVSSGYRFVTLLDVMYEHRARLLCWAEGTPTELFKNIVTRGEHRQMDAKTAARADLVVDENLARLAPFCWSRFPVPAASDLLPPSRDCIPLPPPLPQGFAKERTISRLIEMQSVEYAEAWAEAHHLKARPGSV